jgi:hypothetical protein
VIKNAKFNWFRVGVITAAIAGLSACSTTEEQPDQLQQQNQQSQQNINGSLNQGEMNQGEMNQEFEQNQGNSANINSENGDEFAEQNSGDLNLEQGLQQNFAGNEMGNEVTANNSEMLNATTSNPVADMPVENVPIEAVPANAAPINTAPMNPALSGTVPVNTATAAAEPMAPVAVDMTVWETRGRVKYARRDITKHASPGGPVVGSYVQGDHPLVIQQGEWDQLHNGTWVESSGLSQTGIGRRKSVQPWR